MVSTFQPICSSLNIILVGITGTKNGIPWRQVLAEMDAVTRDIRQRVLYDPTAEFAGGFSGGGECSYMFSRMRAQHVAGLFEMSGWLGRGNNGTSVSYYGMDRVQTNLLVARTTGSSDTSTLFYNPFDSNYLATCSAVVRDWHFAGGHQVPPSSMFGLVLGWLQATRIPAGATDRADADALATNWQARIDNGEYESVLRECVTNLMNHPRSWFAYQAQRTLDALFTHDTVIRSLKVDDLAQGDFASDLFFYSAYTAATNADWTRYHSSMKALTGITVTNDFEGTTTIDGINVTAGIPTTNGVIFITTTNGDRAGDIYSLLATYNQYPSPWIQATVVSNGALMSVSLIKDTPGLGYSLQSQSGLATNTWQNLAATILDTNTTWSATFIPPPGVDRSFYRVSAMPIPATSPPWPQ